MSECTSVGCGTGINSGVTLPGDPDNNYAVSASSAYGGIDVTWTMPALNDHAVAYTIVYRSTTDDFAQAVERARVSGTFYFDRTESANRFQWYYWVRIVSINGTVFEPVGPATATAMPRIDEMLAILTGRIDSGLLADSLKGDLARINTLSLQQVADRQAQIETNGELSSALSGIQASMEETNALIYQEQQARADDNSALVEGINAATAATGEQLANVQETMTAFADELEGVGSQYTVVLTAGAKDPNGGDAYTIGGFGIYNDGSVVQAGFDVDEFWIGRSDGTASVKPFIVEKGTTYINEAVIQSLVFNKLRADDGSLIVEGGRIKADYLDVQELIANALTVDSGVVSDSFSSANYSAGKSGWRLNRDGSIECMNLTAKGNIQANSLAADAVDVVTTVNIAGNSIRVSDVTQFNYNDRHNNLGNLSNYEVAALTSSYAGANFSTAAALITVLIDIRLSKTPQNTATVTYAVEVNGSIIATKTLVSLSGDSQAGSTSGQWFTESAVSMHKIPITRENNTIRVLLTKNRYAEYIDYSGTLVVDGTKV